MNPNRHNQLIEPNTSEMSTSSTVYFYDVIAKTGDTLASVGNLTGFEDSPSLNDLGLVAFVGKIGSIEDLLVGDGDNSLKNLSDTFASSFTRAVQI